jgi:hypothetical protein
MIDITKLTEKDVGKCVTYHTFYKIQKGVIKTWNERYIFVVYNCNHDWSHYENYTAAATKPEDLRWG